MNLCAASNPAAQTHRHHAQVDVGRRRSKAIIQTANPISIGGFIFRYNCNHQI
jgi:hypothetical protein